jgi:signal transduction histidine kinase
MLLAGTFLISLLAFQPVRFIGNSWIPLGAPLLSLAISFYLMIPFRLYSEHRKRYALEEEKTALLAVEEMKTNFIQLVTHDLKTPVARIQGLTEQLKRSLSERMTPKDRELLDHLLSANHSLNHFIGSLLELTKLDKQGIRVQLQSRDINPLLDQVIQKHRFSAQAKQIELHSSYEPLFPIRIDPDLISKVLSNLIDNAIKYSPEGRRVEISTSETDTHVEIRISDQGVGIPESEVLNLFRRFHRIKNDAAYSVKGTGLGLYLSRYFIEAHRGTISVESSPGKGTTFTVRLPVDLKEQDLNSLPIQTQKEMPYA